MRSFALGTLLLEGITWLCTDCFVDIGLLFDKIDSIGHVFLSSEMGLRKTKIFAATVEAMA